MIQETPQIVKNNFYKGLSLIVENASFDSLKKVYEKIFNGKKEDIPSIFNPLKEDWKWNNIDETRFRPESYYRLPTEINLSQMNCFEKASFMYFAAMELCPQKSPQLIYHEKEKNLHAKVLIREKNQTYVIDPSWRIFRKANIGLSGLIYEENNEIKEIPFNSITQISQNQLEIIAKSLRQKKGLPSFIYESGQMMSRAGSGISRQNLFMYFTSEGKLISELRMTMAWEDTSGSAIRKIYDLETKKQSVELLDFKSSWWRTLRDETPFDFDKKEDGTFEFKNQIVLSKFFDFSKNPNQLFLTSKNQVKEIYSKEIDRAEEIGIGRDKVTNLLRTIVSPKEIKEYKRSMKIYEDSFNQNKEEDKVSKELSRVFEGFESFKRAQEIKSLGEIATNLILLAEDSKKYTKAFLEEIL